MGVTNKSGIEDVRERVSTYKNELNVCCFLFLEILYYLEPKGTDGVTADGVLWSGEGGVDQSVSLPVHLHLDQVTHRLCRGNFWIKSLSLSGADTFSYWTPHVRLLVGRSIGVGLP